MPKQIFEIEFDLGISGAVDILAESRDEAEKLLTDKIEREYEGMIKSFDIVASEYNA
jgi:hypothetical protein